MNDRNLWHFSKLSMEEMRDAGEWYLRQLDPAAFYKVLFTFLAEQKEANPDAPAPLTPEETEAALHWYRTATSDSQEEMLEAYRQDRKRGR